MSKTRVLVLLSAYNGEKYLREQAESVLSQEGGFELVLRIRNDGSTDGTEALIRSLMEEYPGRVEYLAGENLGYNASFFTLIDSAEGYDVYMICDQDDKWLPGKVEAAARALQSASGPVLYSARSRTADETLQPLGMTRGQKRPLVPANTLVQNICPGHNQAFNQALMDLIRRPRDVSRIYVYDLWIANLAALYGRIIFD